MVAAIGVEFQVDGVAVRFPALLGGMPCLGREAGAGGGDIDRSR
jgi:hypothetical protein